MDLNAFSMCQENNLLVRVFKFKKGNLLKASKGDDIGTLITN
jgi:uridylate kinase